MKQRVLLTGNDAVDLLHRISTIDTKRLNEVTWTPGLILSVQGKILCFFEVKKPSVDSLEIQFNEKFLELFDQYTFGERYSIQSLPSETLKSELTSEATRIQSLTPQEGHEFLCNGVTNPLEINLQFAIHENKGCYPGQEVIEKIISLGSPARKLCLLEGKTSELLPTPLFDPTTGAEVGMLTSSESDSHFSLGIIKRTHHHIGARVNSTQTSFTIRKVQP